MGRNVLGNAVSALLHGDQTSLICVQVNIWLSGKQWPQGFSAVSFCLASLGSNYRKIIKKKTNEISGQMISAKRKTILSND